MKYDARAIVIVHGKYTYRLCCEEESVLVRYATYLVSKKGFRSVFATLRAACLGEFNQGFFCHFDGSSLLSAAPLGALNQ